MGIKRADLRMSDTATIKTAPHRDGTAAASQPARSDVGDKPRCNRARTTNDPCSRFNGRTSEGRRARDLFVAYSAQLGGNLGAGTAALLLAAVEQLIIAERVRADYLAGNASHNDVIRGEGGSNRALRRLGLNKPPKRRQQSIAEALHAAGIKPPGASPAERVAEQPGKETPTTALASASERVAR
jgi:hypothetical protein